MTGPATPPGAGVGGQRVPIHCSGAAHGPHGSGPVLGFVEGHTDPTAPYGYLCDGCSSAHVAHSVAHGVTPPRIPPATPATHLVPTPGQ